MHRRSRIAALAGAFAAAAAAATSLAPAPAPAAEGDAAPIASLARDAGPPARQPLEFAIQDDPEFLHHPERLDATLAEVRELGFTHVRLSAHWDQLTRAPGATRRPRFAAASPGAYEQSKWRALDRAVTAATRHGLAVMIDAAFFAPRWATSGPDQFGPRPRYRIDRRAFADFAVAIARRYSGRFATSPRARTALPRVSLFTMWNEPNLAVFWTPQRRVLRGGRIALDSPTRTGGWSRCPMPPSSGRAPTRGCSLAGWPPVRPGSRAPARRGSPRCASCGRWPAWTPPCDRSARPTAAAFAAYRVTASPPIRTRWATSPTSARAAIASTR